MVLNESIHASYIKIERNILHIQFEEAIYNKCSCLKSDVSPCSRKNNCVNVGCSIECSPGLCPADEKCKNQNFKRGTQLSLQVRKTEQKGWGLFAMEEIEAEQFIIEYVGEVINEAEFTNRYCFSCYLRSKFLTKKEGMHVGRMDQQYSISVCIQ